MEWLTAQHVVPAVALIALLFLIGRRLQGRRWLVIIAITLAIVVLVVAAEQNGLWPGSWTTR